MIPRSGEFVRTRRLRATRAGNSDRAQTVEVADADELAVGVDQAALLEARQRAAHGFEGDAEIAADVVARHAQREFRRRVAAPRKARGQVEQEACDALVGAQRAERGQLIGFADDLRLII
ncbi:hypothetical protein AWB81_05783 [Caballeronia arationis]|nr:hypothetical protein AWB81_05783 [Caballeronia arationis]